MKQKKELYQKSDQTVEYMNSGGIDEEEKSIDSY